MDGEKGDKIEWPLGVARVEGYSRSILLFVLRIPASATGKLQFFKLIKLFFFETTLFTFLFHKKDKHKVKMISARFMKKWYNTAIIPLYVFSGAAVGWAGFMAYRALRGM